MVLLEKNKVTLTLLCDTDKLVPGSTINGTVHADVHEKVSFTALRVRFRGIEESYVCRDSDDTTLRDHHYLTYAEETITLIGAPDESQTTGVTQLEPGNYSYPYSLTVPQGLPPSFSIKRGSYGCSMIYTLQGILDIPYGFDAQVEIQMSMLQPVSVAQLQAARQTQMLLPVSEAGIAECGCYCCCFCCTDEESFIRTEAAVAPHILVMSTGVQLPAVTALPTANDGSLDGLRSDWAGAMPVASDVSCGLLRIRVTNHTKDQTPDRCRVVLSQKYKFRHDGHSDHEEHAIFLKRDLDFRTGPLGPGQSVILEVPFQVDGEKEDRRSGELLIPSLNTKYFSALTELDIFFPGIKADGTMHSEGSLQLATAVDMTHQCGPLF